VLVGAAASSTQFYFERTQVIQTPKPADSGFPNGGDGDWAAVEALSKDGAGPQLRRVGHPGRHRHHAGGLDRPQLPRRQHCVELR